MLDGRSLLFMRFIETSITSAVVFILAGTVWRRVSILTAVSKTATSVAGFEVAGDITLMDLVCN